MFSAFSWIEANMYSVLNSTIKLDTSLNTYFSAILDTSYMQHCSSAWWLWTFSAICLNLDFWFYIFFIASQIIISRAIKIHFISIDVDTIMASGLVNFIKIYWFFFRKWWIITVPSFFCLFLCENFMKHLGSP